ncbi:hypothetical protein ETAA8_29630 [Anatilimnocola aggregata]|uniref:Uncharacterized protein n=1 Tax=Anatilimnocola aggregata TaxID=2528021 RepID=A0A517YCL5_9BACT|nr:hypothetical protein [Anatilimnocola aggregata]QDU27872.1 hypothetical protein ETAA8_29630 [Anatilimnocola aggregata]
MSTFASLPARGEYSESTSAVILWWPVPVVVVFVLAAWLLAACAPLGFSIVAVFLFAGPHNWMEARYMLRRMPAKWGPLTGYFALGIGGTIALAAWQALFPWLGRSARWSADDWLSTIALWNTALVVWIISLALLRSTQNPRRDWRWLIPVGLLLIGLNWLWPLGWSLALVYIHPLVALTFLERELARAKSPWLTAYRGCLALLPLLLGLLWWTLRNTPDLPGEDILSLQISQHAGDGILSGISTHLLVATHTFLEMLHYGVWLIAVPLLAGISKPWQLEQLPLARRGQIWRIGIACLLALGLIIVIALWAGFAADYPLTRNVYFTVAMLHVLAEVPFLLRLL